MSLLWTILAIALRRLVANVGLALCALLALVIAVALAISIPVYAEAASLRVLQDELARQEARQGRSPFAILARYVASQNQNRALPWSAVAPADTLLTTGAPGRFGLPLTGLARHARSEPMRLVLPGAGGTPTSKLVNLGFLDGLDAQIRLLDGAQPAPANSLDRPIEALVSRALAEEVGLNVGDELRALSSVRGRPLAISLRVAGIWEAVSPRDPAWPLHIDSVRDVLLLPEATFVGPVATTLETPVSQILWYARLDPAGLTPARTAPLLARVERLRAEVAGLLPGLRIEQGPAEPLARYRSAATALTTQLAVVAAPTLLLVVIFVVLVAGLLAQRQAGEVALLKARGARDGQILAIAATEWLLLGLVAWPAGLWLGLAAARLVAATNSFLRFDPTLPPLAVGPTPEALWAGALVVALALTAALLPIAAATRRMLAEAQRDRSRVARPPLWQRSYTDLLLLAPALYGLFLLRQEDGILGGRDPVANPLLLAVPALLCLGLGLLLVRVAPRALELLARLAAHPPWVAPLLALRALARQPETYRGSLLLLILTLSLAVVSAGVATTADATLRAAVTYRVGAATQLIEMGESTERLQSGSGGTPTQRDIDEEPRFLFVPVGDHLTVPGITAATRVGRYDATMRLGDTVTRAQLVGIDRLSFPRVVTAFDPAWAGGVSLGALMNLLGAYPDGVLVSRALLDRGLRVGDRLPITAELFGDNRELSLRIVEAIDLWPGVYPQDGPILVMNLDALFDQMGGQYPFNVWIARDPEVPLANVASGVRRLGVTLVDVLDVAELTRAEQTRPQRQGLFGMLSVGFLAAGGLSVISFVLSAVIVGQQRSVELGVLRAMGLGRGNAAAAILLEQSALVGVGVGGGLAVGVGTAALVVPSLQVGVGPWPGTPPVPVIQPWDKVALLGLLATAALGLAVVALLALQGRLRLIQAVKLGEVG